MPVKFVELFLNCRMVTRLVHSQYCGFFMNSASGFARVASDGKKLGHIIGIPQRRNETSVASRIYG